MNKILIIFLSISILLIALYLHINIDLNKMTSFIYFILGAFWGIITISFIISIKNNKIGLFKRKLEKESIKSIENSSKVKILESKIKVLEKALENALNNK